MGKIQKRVGFVFLFAMLLFGNTLIAKGATGLTKGFSYNDLYGYQSFSNNKSAQLFYEEIDRVAYACYTSTADMEQDENCLYVAGEADYYRCGLTSEEAVQVYYTYRKDHPEYYWLSSTMAYDNISIYIVMDEAYAKGSVRQRYDDMISRYVENVCQRVAGMSKDKQVSYLHDLIVNETFYAYEADGVTPERAPWAHNVIGYLEGKGVVCEGYTRMFQLLLNALEIDNAYVSGESRGEDHAWNIVKMGDGKWYWFDLTWDDHTNWELEETSRFFYAMPNRLFMQTHEPDSPDGEDGHDLYELPEASEDFRYYCTTGVNELHEMTTPELIDCIQIATCAEVQAGNHYVMYYIPPELEKDFNALMFNGFYGANNQPYLYYQLYMNEVPEIYDAVGDIFSYRKIDDYLYVYFDYAKIQKPDTVFLYEGQKRIGSYGTVTEAIDYATQTDGDYRITYLPNQTGHMIPVDRDLPKVSSIEFSGCVDSGGRAISLLYLPKDTTMQSDWIIKDLYLMGASNQRTTLYVNGHQLKTTGQYAYIGHPGDVNSQVVDIEGKKGSLVVGTTSHTTVVGSLNIQNLKLLSDGVNNNIVCLSNSANITTLNAQGNTGCLLVENSCVIGDLKSDSYMHLVVYPGSKSKVRILNDVEGSVNTIYDLSKWKESGYTNLQKYSYIYAPNTKEEQWKVWVEGGTKTMDAQPWFLCKDNSGYYYLVGDEKHAATSSSTTIRKTSSGVTYRIVKNVAGDRRAEYVKPKENAKGAIVVPDTVYLKGKKYKVVSVANNAWKGNTKITTIRIGKNVTKIGKQAFYGCKKLNTITVQSSKLTSVGSNALKSVYKKAVIKVPSKMYKKYTKLFKGKGQAKTVKVKK
ncbi:MAG: leucine-rich repeat protein [Eubacteriales bacterium]|nr:leucine-rich repeat protein [Eubacteriales bacterium]